MRPYNSVLSPRAAVDRVLVHVSYDAAAMLDVAWSGKFSPGLRGLYRAGPLAVTQFEAADARRVFPCFDEPAFKARWNLVLVGLPEGVAAISNGPILKDQKEPGGGRTVQFAETPKLSSYLIAICAGELASSPEQKARSVPVRTWEAGGRVHVEVSDTGSGIDPEVRKRLFQPFFTTRPEGTGLGLAIMRSVVDAHGGEVEVRSEPGRGTTFTVHLPCQPAVAGTAR